MEDGEKIPLLQQEKKESGHGSALWKMGAAVFLLDQGSKWAAISAIGNGEEKTVIEGFFKFVHWHNTGAAWSIMQNQNTLLMAISAIAFIGLIFYRSQFDIGSQRGRIALSLLCGGILGNLADRLIHGHVVDFIRFYLKTRGQQQEVGFPAFNVADTAICVGVGLMFYSTWKAAKHGAEPPGAPTQA